MNSRLGELRERLESVCKGQQYHLMMDLDTEIQQCVIDVVTEAKKAPERSSQVSGELKELMEQYALVVARCEEKSQQLKQEYMKVKGKKQGAGKYLDVASQFT